MTRHSNWVVLFALLALVVFLFVTNPNLQRKAKNWVEIGKEKVLELNPWGEDDAPSR